MVKFISPQMGVSATIGTLFINTWYYGRVFKFNEIGYRLSPHIRFKMRMISWWSMKYVC